MVLGVSRNSSSDEDDLPEPLAIIEPREWEDPDAERRDAAVSYTLITIAACALLVALAHWAVPVLIGPRQAQACPTVGEAQLNPYEYELQRRRCEAITARTADQVEAPMSASRINKD
jgi:hypothetical protein